MIGPVLQPRILHIVKSMVVIVLVLSDKCHAATRPYFKHLVVKMLTKIAKNLIW
jgi:hypothetical protein